MGDWLVPPDYDKWFEAVTPASSGAGVAIPAVGTANTKGAWQQLTGAVSDVQAGLVLVTVQAGTTSPTDGCIDIGVGAAGSEQIVIPDLLVSRGSGGDVPFGHYQFPLSIAAFARVAARGAFSTTTGTGRVHLHLAGQPTFSGVTEPGGAVQCVGAGAAGGATLSRGTSLDPGATANTKGAYSQLAASTTKTMWNLTIAVGNASQTRTNGGSWAIDVAIGAAGSEQIVLPDLLVASPAGARLPMPYVLGPFPVIVPAGSRVAARCSCSVITADRVIDLAGYGTVL